MLESRLYKTVELFTADHYACHAVQQQVGTRLGKVDVIGLRDVGSDFGTSSELITVEVKEEGASFLTAIGQARVYSIYAHKCYLAVRKRYGNKFTPEETDIAMQLGVGLIEIRSSKCHEVLSSQLFSPQERYVLQILNKLNYFQCTLCRGTYPKRNIQALNTKQQIDLQSDPKYTGQLVRAIKQRKHAIYWLFEMSYSRKNETRSYVYDRRYICKDCLSLFASLISA